MTRMVGSGLAVLMIVAANAAAQPVAGPKRQTANTYAFVEGQARPVATIKDMAWLAGSWQGPALGGPSDEVWSQPAARSMYGMYRLTLNDAVVFYELLTIVEEAGSLTLKLKHFNADLTGWEEKAEVRSFPLVSLTPTEAAFDGMTFQHQGDDITVYLAIQDRKTKTIREETFKYTRVRHY